MTTAVVMPDAVKLTRLCLLGCSALTAIVQQRVATQSPQDVSTPWVRLHRIGGPVSLTAPMRLDNPRIQVDCFAPAKASQGVGVVCGDEGAMKVARIALAWLLASAGFSDDEGIIAYVSNPQGLQNSPDTSRTPPTPRVIFTVAITTRPS